MSDGPSSNERWSLACGPELPKTNAMTPEPPPGYRLLTDEEKTKPLPMDAILWCPSVNEWRPSLVAGSTSRVTHYRYATRATSEVESLRAEVDRLTEVSRLAAKASEIRETELAEARKDSERRGILLGRILQRCYDTKAYKDKGHVCENRQTVESIVQMIEAHNAAAQPKKQPPISPTP